MPKARPIPADFAEFAPDMTNIELHRHYGVHERLIRRWRKHSGIPLPSGSRGSKPIYPLPKDFAARAPHWSRYRTSLHYEVNPDVVKRWEQQAGVACNSAKPPRREPHVGSLAQKQARSRALQAQTRMLRGPVARPDSMDTRAAEYLRRLAPVYRCDERGKMDERGELWRYGNAILSPDEIQERARRRGWAPDAWARIAA